MHGEGQKDGGYQLNSCKYQVGQSAARKAQVAQQRHHQVPSEKRLVRPPDVVWLVQLSLQFMEVYPCICDLVWDKV